jgi:hypothetical protein
MDEHFERIRDEIQKGNVKSKSKVEKYENTKCWSYAYLSRWVVLECGLKSLYNKKQTRSIPQYKCIKKLLGECNRIKNAIDSGGKCRPKRNRIAHKAEEFRSETTYLNCKKGVDDAIQQLLTKLT